MAATDENTFSNIKQERIVSTKITTDMPINLVKGSFDKFKFIQYVIANQGYNILIHEVPLKMGLFNIQSKYYIEE